MTNTEHNTRPKVDPVQRQFDITGGILVVLVMALGVYAAVTHLNEPDPPTRTIQVCVGPSDQGDQRDLVGNFEWTYFSYQDKPPGIYKVTYDLTGADITNLERLSDDTSACGQRNPV